MSDLLGSTLGPYRILEQIGLGGMATVYKAYQPGMDRLVALKVLPHHYARDPRFIKRFEQEAKVIAKLEHRNIVPVYDFGEQDGTAYLAMRYLQAGTVKEILSHGPLPLSDAAKLLSDIAAALDHAHSQGIIHRDVKPSNVLVDKQGNAYLTDFGIAKVIESTMEMTGSAALGTPAYMAPEQTLGKAVTPQSDVYSLGVMLYEMVTGKPPFEADTPMAIALMHVHEPLPLPRKVKADLPEAVELVVLKALAKEVKDRYQSAGEVARAFGEAAGAEAVTTSTRLVELASVAATGKGSEEITYDIREEIRKRESTEQRKRLMSWVPWAIGTTIIFTLLGVAIWLSRQATSAQASGEATSLALANTAQAAVQTANRPSNTPEATATLDIYAAATQLQALTHTQGAFETATKAVVLTLAEETQSAQETIFALTPSNTPTRTRTPTNTPLPLPTSTPVPRITTVNMVDASVDPRVCIPNPVSAGIILFNTAVGGFSSAEEAAAAVGDSWPSLTANSESALGINRSGPVFDESHSHWKYTAQMRIVLEPGEYVVAYRWYHPNWVVQRTLVVTAP